MGLCLAMRECRRYTLAMNSFSERVYEKLKLVPKGMITTYKELGGALGTKAYRAVGNALRSNPYAPEVPCHRVVASDGRIGGFMGSKIGKNIEKKIEMLKEEGVYFTENKVKDFEKVLYRF